MVFVRKSYFSCGLEHQLVWVVYQVVRDVLPITNLVAYFHWGKRLLGNMKHHFRDLCKVGALSGSGGKWAILMPKWGEWEILMPWFLHLFVLKFLTFLILALKLLTFLRDPECAWTLHKSLKWCYAFSQSLFPFFKALVCQNDSHLPALSHTNTDSQICYFFLEKFYFTQKYFKFSCITLI